MNCSRRCFIGGSLAAVVSPPGGRLTSPIAAGGDGKFFEPGGILPVHDGYDLIVAGGGPAGISAAVAAARTGMKVAILELHGSLGGVWTSGLLGCVLDFDQCATTREITDRLDALGARHESDRSTYTYEPEYMKLVLDGMCLDAGVDVRLHTHVVAAWRDASGRRIETIVTESKSGREAWRAPIFVDATGDGDLAALSGCGFDIGDGRGNDQPASMCVLLAVNDAKALEPYSVFRRPWLEATDAFAAELRRAGVKSSYRRPTLYVLHPHLVLMMANHEYHVRIDGAASVTVATMRAREENFRLVDALSRLGGVWNGVRLVATPEQLGHRTARRIHGRASVVTKDLIEGARHPDGVCTAHFTVDIHAPDENAPATDDRNISMKPYQIPLRALRARDVDNLWMAGRCLSGDFVSHSSYRVTGVAVATGEAVGRAVAKGPL